MSVDADERSFRRYLLGDLPEETRDELEARYFADDDIFARLLAEEDALATAYLRGELSPAERVLFEKSVLSSADGRRRLQITGGLIERARVRMAARLLLPAPHVSRSWTAAAAAAVVLVALSVGWRIRERERPVTPRTVVQRPHPVETPTSPARSMNASPAPAPPTGVSVVTAVLATGLARGAGAATVVAIPPGTDAVHLRLLVPRIEHPRYRVSIQTPEGRERAATDARVIVAGTGAVEVEIPSSALEAGTYVATLRGLTRDGRAETVAEYAFRVTREIDRPRR